MRRIAKPHFARQQTTKTPSCRWFPLRAEGTAQARGLVPLAKRGEPQGGGLVWKWVWVLVVVSCWQQATAQPADLSQDPLLQKRITVWLKMEPLRDALRTIGKQTGVALRCQDAIAEEKVAIFVRERPAHEILTQLAGALRYAWRKDADAYVLYVPDETRKAEEKAARALAQQRNKALRDTIRAMRRLAALPHEQRREILRNLQHAPEQVEPLYRQIRAELISHIIPRSEMRLVYDSESDLESENYKFVETGVYSYEIPGVILMCLALLPESAVNKLARSEWVGFSTKPAEGVYPFPQGVVIPEGERNHTVTVKEGDEVWESDPQNPEFVGIWMRYLPQFDLLVSRLVSLPLVRNVDSEKGTTEHRPLCTGEWWLRFTDERRGEEKALDYWIQWAAPNAELEGILKGRISPKAQPPQAPRYASLYFLPRAEITTVDLLEQLAVLTDIFVISDAFRIASLPNADIHNKLPAAIESLSKQLWLRWDESGYLLARHQRYWEARPLELPESWLRPLEEKYRKRALTMDDYVALAGQMTQAQMDSLHYRTTPLAEFDFYPLWECLQALRFLASLNPVQRQTLESGEWLPANRLTPLQRQRFSEVFAERFPPVDRLFSEPLPPTDEVRDLIVRREKLYENYFEQASHFTPSEPSLRCFPLPEKLEYGVEWDGAAVYSNDPQDVVNAFTRADEPGLLFSYSYQANAVEFVGRNGQFKRYVFAIRYREPFKKLPRSDSQSSKEREEKP